MRPQGFNLRDTARATPSMSSSLQKMYTSLNCPICHKLMMDPTTLSCTHSFCLDCISNAKEWTCVVPGCNVPVTVRGQKSYRINPQLSSVISSLEVIQKTMNRAQPQWWKSSSLSQTSSMDSYVDLGVNMNQDKDADADTSAEDNIMDSHENGVVDLSGLPPGNDSDNKNEEEHDDDDDSEATTLDYDIMDGDSISAPVLKRQKKESTATFFGTRTPRRTHAFASTSSETNLKFAKIHHVPSKSKSHTPADDESVATENRNDIEIHNLDHNSASINVKKSRNQNPNDANDDNDNDDDDDSDNNQDDEEHHGFFSENQTPQDLNKSCAIPEVSFRLSPIAMGDSQNPSPLKEVGILDDIVEEMSGMDATTEEIDAASEPNESSQNNMEMDTGEADSARVKETSDSHHKSADIKQVESDEGGTSTCMIPNNNVNKPPSILKKIQENIPIEDQKASTRNLGAKQKHSEKQSDADEVNARHTKRKKIPEPPASKLAPNVLEEQEIELTANDSRPPIPQVFLISPSQSLSSADQRSIRKFAKNERLQILQPERPERNEIDFEFSFDFDSNEDVDSFMHSLYTIDTTSHFPIEYSYAICSNAEYQTFEGYIMPRSFRFVLAVACGLSIIDISYLRKATSASFGIHDSRKYLYAPGTFKDDDMAQSGNRRKRSRGREVENKEENYQVAGDVDSMELMGPQRSRETLMKRLGERSEGNFKYNNGLLDDYVVLLFGDFDELHVRVPILQTSGKQKRRGRAKIDKSNSNASDAMPDNVYTKGRVSLLLSLCGANLADFHSYDNNSFSTSKINGKNVIILTRNETNTQTKKRMKSMLKNNGVSDDRVKDIPVVCCKWLEDSIACFKVKNIDEFKNA